MMKPRNGSKSGHRLRIPDNDRILYQDFIDRFYYSAGRIIRYGSSKTGNLAPNGYHRTAIDGISYRTHHLVWFYFHKRWPVEIDHINKNKNDNRIENLREVTRSENLEFQNKKISIATLTGVKIGEYASQKEAASALGIKPSSISMSKKKRSWMIVRVRVEQ